MADYLTTARDGLNMIYNQDESMTLDQRLKAVEVEALLAIGQELNALRLGDREMFT